MSAVEQRDAIVKQIRSHSHSHSQAQPKVAIMLGTGLGGLADKIEADARIPFSSLAGMPTSTAESHKGEFIIGKIGSVGVVACSGRLHCYEGYSAAEVVLPVRVMQHLGAKILIMGSAVGGLDPRHRVGDLVVLEDHINMMGVNPLVGPNDDRIGSRWPDMIAPYDAELRALAKTVALEQHIQLTEAVYAGVMGPCLETRAEYRMLRTIGADVVGMSTVPEAIAAVHCGLRTLAFAVITDRCLPDALQPANIKNIIAAANEAEPLLTNIIAKLLPRIAH